MKYKKYSELIKLLPETKQNQAADLVTDLNFLNQTLQMLRSEIKKSGVVIEWKNGAQGGVKEAPALKSYNATLGKKTAVIRMLNGMLDEVSTDVGGDELSQFIIDDITPLKLAE